MTNKKLHPSVEKFKSFVKENPSIIKEVRSGKATWQELYEDWYLLGEEDARWKSVGTDTDSNETHQKEEHADATNKQAWMSSVMDTLKNMDQNQLQGYIANLSQALGTIQGVISQFSSDNGATTSSTKTSEQKPTGPFSFKKD